MTYYETPSEALMIEALMLNEMGVGGFTKPTMKGVAGAIGDVPRRLLSAVPGRQLITDRLDAREYAEQQERLQKLGAVAVVRDYPPEEIDRDRKSGGDRIRSMLREGRVLERGRIVAIQPVIYATAYRDDDGSLTNSARALSKSIRADRAKGETFFNPEPLVVHGEGGQASRETYGAFDELARPMELRTKELSGEDNDTYVRPPGLIFVMNVVHIANELKGVTHDEAMRSGVVVLVDADPLPEKSIWRPGSMPLPADWRPVEHEPSTSQVTVPVSKPPSQAAQPSS